MNNTSLDKSGAEWMLYLHTIASLLDLVQPYLQTPIILINSRTLSLFFPSSEAIDTQIVECLFREADTSQVRI